MSYYISKRKKIRGWKRRMRQVEGWGKLVIEPDLDCFQERGYTYERCTVIPSQVARDRYLPLWFYKNIITTLIAVQSNWINRFDRLETNYDLVIWIYDPAYGGVEIICYKTNKPGEVKHSKNESEATKPFPFRKLSSPNYDLTAFNWTLVNDLDEFDHTEFEHADFTPEDLIADGFERKVREDGEVYYSKRWGDLWVGRHKSRKQ